MSSRRILIAASGLAGAALVVLVLALTGAFSASDNGNGNGSSNVVVGGTAFAKGTVSGDRINQIYERSTPSVVFIQSQIKGTQQSPFGPAQGGGTASGTGFVVDAQGHIATNAHVIENASKVQVQFKGNQLVNAKVVGSDLATDLAVLDAKAPNGTKALSLGDSANVKVGDPVLAIGNPFALEDTITAGIISALQRQITAPNGLTIDHVIQTDAAVNPGNSGGPLLDFNGRVVGINSQIATGNSGAEGNVGIAFAIPVNTVKQIVPELLQNGKVNRGYLGVGTVPVTPSMASVLGLGTSSGAYIVSIQKGSPADKAGLHAGGGGAQGAIGPGGDVIVAISGKKIASADDVANAVATRKPGDQVSVDYVRGKSRHSVQVTLAQRPG
ncbi:MAG: S1C family serine protease [Thermoleophilaceae bacterium]